ncbi:MAG: alkaline phosphatase family protein [Cohaesibacter sp.]|jgi:arylsulfatase A-like enzyme|nr:alkaline phosphatase family protein [Cohaesibacter sp.]
MTASQITPRIEPQIKPKVTSKNKPNILLITADQWRGDCLGAAGHPTLKTPNIDALIADAVHFTNHYTTTAPCSAARASLYTGLYQMNHRVVQNGAPLAHDLDNIARAARRAGYLPTLFGYTDTSHDPRTLHPNDPDLRSYEKVLPGMHLGQLLPENDKPWITWLKEQGHQIEDASKVHIPPMEEGERVSLQPPSYGEQETQTAFLLQKFYRWLDEQEDEEKPWFAHISFLRPHPPFIVPEPFASLYEPQEGSPYQRLEDAASEAQSHPLMELLQQHQSMSSFLNYDKNGAFGGSDLVKDLSAHDIDRIRAIYYGMISEVDAKIGEMIAELKQRGEWDNTLVILTSDHAEMMGDHWMLGKGGYHQGSYHIPLVIRAPHGARGHKVEAFTSAADIFPTLLDALGSEALNSLDGKSLMEFACGKSVPDWRDAAFFEFDFRILRKAHSDLKAKTKAAQCSLAVLRDHDFHYVHCPGFPALLFDLKKDPHCLENVAQDEAYMPVRLRYAEKMLDLRAEHLDETLARYMVGEDGVVIVD